MFGRMATNSLASKRVATIVMKNIINATSSVQSRSVYTAQALKEDCPEIYNNLKPKDLDLLYFFVESLMEPVVDAINIRRTDGQAAFERKHGDGCG